MPTASTTPPTLHELAHAYRVKLLEEFHGVVKHPLITRPVIDSSGVYALYYNGQHPLYAKLSEPALSHLPLYVGVTTGSLEKRLSEHESSLEVLGFIADVQCKMYPVIPNFEISSEQILIHALRPVWNLRLRGFGLHNPGLGRKDSKISDWDTLHPGRPFEGVAQDINRGDELRKRVMDYIDSVYQQQVQTAQTLAP